MGRPQGGTNKCIKPPAPDTPRLQLPLYLNCHAPATGWWSPPPKVLAVSTILTPNLRSYVEFVPGSTCEPAGNDGSSVLAGKPYEPDSGRRKPQIGTNPMVTNDPPRTMHAADIRWTQRRSLPLALGFARSAVQKFYASSWPRATALR